jgi:succinoglycan biosynthesis transport protein ExoP
MNRRDNAHTQLSVRQAGAPIVSAAKPASPQDPAAFLPTIELGRVFGFLLRRSWLVVVFGALGIACSLLFLKNSTKVYRSYGSVYVGTQAPQVLNIQAVSQEESRDLEQMRSVEQGMLSSTTLLRLVEKHGLAADPHFAPPGAGQEMLAKALGRRVRVELRRGTRLIDIAVDDTDPVRAKDLVQSIVDEYEKSSAERQESITRQASEGLAREEQRLRVKMEESSQKLQKFRESHRVPGLDAAPGSASPDDNVASLTTQLGLAKSERLRLESEYESFKKFDPKDPGALAGAGNSEQASEVISQVRAIQEKEAEFATVKERYLEKHPNYIAISSELALLRKNLEESAAAAGDALEKKYRIAMENETKLTAALASAKVDAVEVEGLRESFRTLDREADADRTLHDAVAARLRETHLTASVPTSVLRWEGSPMIPEKPHSPRKIVALALGSGAGVFMGLLLMVGLELADGRIRDAGSAARAAGVPLLARIPSASAADAFRQLRAILSPDDGSQTARTILFASARGSEGRSFCALNYATSLAVQGHRTLLLDADLRSAGISAEHLERSGLGDFLAGDVAPAEVCFTTSQPNLYLLSSGAPRPDSGDLLASSRFAALLEDAYRWFDRVVIDTPPLLDSVDAAVIARYADRCCLVVSNQGAHRRSLRQASETLRSAGGSLVGFVWNEVPRGRNSRAAGPTVRPSHPLIGGNTTPRSESPKGLAS